MLKSKLRAKSDKPDRTTPPNPPGSRVALAFAVAPLVPALLLGSVFLLSGNTVALVFYCGMAIVLGYIGALVLGTPAYLIMSRRGLVKLTHYVVAGISLALVLMGLLCSFSALARYLGGGGSIPMILLVPVAIFATLSTTAFWLILRPDRYSR